MDILAFCFGQKEIYWSTVIRVVGLLAAFSLEFSLVSLRGKKREVILLIPFQLLFGFIFARLIFWDCNLETYPGLQAALTDFSLRGMCYDGIIFGCILAVWPVRLLYGKTNVKNLYDVSALAALLYAIIVRMSQYYRGECRSWILVTNEKYMKLPFSVESVSATGFSSFNVATFAIDAILLSLVFAISLVFFFKHKKDEQGVGLTGHTALLSMSMMAAVTAVTDSSRNDASHFRFNGFVSQTQIFFLIFLLAVIIFYSIRSVRSAGLSRWHFVMWVGILLGLVNAGILEYYKQRYSEFWYYWLPIMFVSLVSVTIIIFALYLFSGGKKELKESKVKIVTE